MAAKARIPRRSGRCRAPGKECPDWRDWRCRQSRANPSPLFISPGFPETRENTGHLADSGIKYPNSGSHKCPESRRVRLQFPADPNREFFRQNSETVNETGTCGRFKSRVSFGHLRRSDDLLADVAGRLRPHQGSGRARAARVQAVRLRGRGRSSTCSASAAASWPRCASERGWRSSMRDA